MNTAWRNFLTLFLFSLVLILSSVTIAVHAESFATATVDSVTAGDEKVEKGHKQAGDQTEIQQLNGHTYRIASTNGWFSWELKMLPDAAQELDIEFGGERHRPADTVDIFANEIKIATVRLAGGPRAEYYPLTNTVLKGKDAITVKFQASVGSRIDGIANVSVVKVPPPTIASASTASSTRTNWQFIVNAVKDQHEPKSSGDRLKRHFDWWPAKGTNQWVQYDFAKPTRVSAVEVYWFDDTGIGECRLPKSWRVLYRDNGEWKAVANPTGYSCEGDRYNRTTFDAVETEGLRLDVQLPERFSSGLLQWKVE
ncbi:MAG TPA: DUF6805 domain-containing protein [Verrucomicrobiae bacterium]|nr:DUF6805 domain-containing protein [Verrucomicrobiae bacterium]